MRDFRLSTATRCWHVSTPLAALLVVGCALESPPRGEVLREGVARATFQQRARHTDLIDVDVYFPSDASGTRIGDGLPGVVFIQGGLVETDRYAWLGEELASRGYVVALPAHPLGLAFFAVDNGQAARTLLVEPPEGSALDGAVDGARIGVAGHSLGGVVATKLALDGGFGALVLQASFPDPVDDARLPQLGIPSLSMAGEKDCQARLEDGVRQGFEKLPSPAVLAVLAGVTHFQFTQDDALDVERSCAPTLPLADAHGRIAEAMALFLRAALEDGGTASGAIDALDGVEVTVR